MTDTCIHKRKRGFFGGLFLALFVLWNIAMLALFVMTGVLGGALLIAPIWLGGALILGLLALVTRSGDMIVIPAAEVARRKSERRAVQLAVILVLFFFWLFAVLTGTLKAEEWQPVGAAARALTLYYAGTKNPVTVLSDDEARIDNPDGTYVLVRRSRKHPCKFGLFGAGEQPEIWIDFSRLTGEYRYAPGWTSGYEITFYGDGDGNSYCFLRGSRRFCSRDLIGGGLSEQQVSVYVRAVSYVLQTDCPSKGVRPY